jgi:hypothetical protein
LRSTVIKSKAESNQASNIKHAYKTKHYRHNLISKHLSSFFFCCTSQLLQLRSSQRESPISRLSGVLIISRRPSHLMCCVFSVSPIAYSQPYLITCISVIPRPLHERVVITKVSILLHADDSCLFFFSESKICKHFSGEESTDFSLVAVDNSRVSTILNY